MNEILIYGDIGFEVQAKDIVNQLNDADGPVTVRVDSFGGDVYAGISILNALRRYPDVVTVYVDGMAASAASFIAVGGADRLIMSPNSSLLIHGAWSQGMGNSEEMAQLASNLNQITDNLATIYAEKTGQEPMYWRELMKQDTTFTAEQAVEAGLADAVDELKKSARAEKRHAVMAAQRSRFAENGGVRGVPEIETRAAAPPPPVTRSESGDMTSMPSDGQEGDAMSIKNLAQELGVEPDELREKLSGFFNEQVEVSGQVDVTYPEETAVAPTEQVTVEPTIANTDGEDGGALGLVFAVSSVPEGWDVTVEESTGAVTAKAPSGVEPGDTVTATVTVNESTEVSVVFKVRSLSESDEEEPTPEPDGGETMGDDVVTVPRAVWDEYMADRAKYSAKLAEDKQRALEAKVDGHIREGRYSAGHRGAAIAAYQTDPVAAEKIWGALPKNVAVPVQEIGHSGDVAGMSKVEKLRAKAAANRQNKKENK